MHRVFSDPAMSHLAELADSCLSLLASLHELNRIKPNPLLTNFLNNCQNNLYNNNNFNSNNFDHLIKELLLTDPRVLEVYVLFLNQLAKFLFDSGLSQLMLLKTPELLMLITTSLAATYALGKTQNKLSSSSSAAAANPGSSQHTSHTGPADYNDYSHCPPNNAPSQKVCTAAAAALSLSLCMCVYVLVTCSVL